MGPRAWARGPRRGQRWPEWPEALAAVGHNNSLADARRGQRTVWFVGSLHETPIYQRNLLPADMTLDGPAIIEQMDCTIVVEPGNRVTLDDLGNLVIEVAR